MGSQPATIPVLVLGHSLAAHENRIPFQSASIPVMICSPKIWRSPGNTKRLEIQSTGNLVTLRVSILGHNSLFIYYNLSNLIRMVRPKLIYMWEEPWSFAAFQIVVLQKIFGFKFIFFSAENRPKKLFFPFSFICKKVFKNSTLAVVPTQDVANQVRRFGYTGEITIIPLWVAFRPHIPITDQMRIAYIGRLIPIKRLTLLIQALYFMPNVILRIIGDGPQKNDLHEISLSLSLSNRIEFVGHTPNEALANSLFDVRLVALLTGESSVQAEQFGKAVLDAVLCGIPAIVAPTGHLTHWANEFDTVRIANCDSPENLAKDLLDALSHPPTNQQLQNSREKALESYGTERASLRFTQLFRDTLGT